LAPTARLLQVCHSPRSYRLAIHSQVMKRTISAFWHLRTAEVFETLGVCKI
jgi:hypothetical protein